MSMTKSEFLRRFRILRFAHSSAPSVFDDEMTALAEEAGVEWAPEPTPEPTGDLSMVRVIDAAGDTWGPALTAGWWVRFDHRLVVSWSEIPQPATVLRPEGEADK